MSVTMTLNNDNELIISYQGTSTEDTLLNCTNHTYFNLSGNLKRAIHNHQLKIVAQSYIPINEEGLPLGVYSPVEKTIFDFNKGKLLEQVIHAEHEQITFASGGLDHPFLLSEKEIELFEAESGRKLTIITQDPCVVVYTGNKIGEDFNFTETAAFDFAGVCLEVQNVPNSSKYSHFPSSLIRENEQYEKKSIYRFSTVE